MQSIVFHHRLHDKINYLRQDPTRMLVYGDSVIRYGVCQECGFQLFLQSVCFFPDCDKNHNTVTICPKCGHEDKIGVPALHLEDIEGLPTWRNVKLP